jgi:hypothetical protein
MADVEKHVQHVHIQFPTVSVSEFKADNNVLTVVHEPSIQSSTSLDDGASRHDYPEGGFRAYLTVFGAFIALFCTFGQMNSFGTYQTWYSDHQLQHLPPSTISWIGSLQLWIFFFSVRNMHFVPLPKIEF